ncbi:MAG: hypothetical protein ACRCUE_16910 [Bosea sp. (in: a-proteobacteria)]
MTIQLPDKEADLFALMRKELFSSVIGDVLDVQGFRHQYLPPNIRPLSDDMVIIGRAMTVLEADFFVEPGMDGWQVRSGNKAIRGDVRGTRRSQAK